MKQTTAATAVEPNGIYDNLSLETVVKEELKTEKVDLP